MTTVGQIYTEHCKKEYTFDDVRTIEAVIKSLDNYVAYYEKLMTDMIKRRSAIENMSVEEFRETIANGEYYV